LYLFYSRKILVAHSSIDCHMRGSPTGTSQKKLLPLSILSFIREKTTTYWLLHSHPSFQNKLENITLLFTASFIRKIISPLFDHPMGCTPLFMFSFIREKKEHSAHESLCRKTTTFFHHNFGKGTSLFIASFILEKYLTISRLFYLEKYLIICRHFFRKKLLPSFVDCPKITLRVRHIATLKLHMSLLFGITMFCCSVSIVPSTLHQNFFLDHSLFSFHKFTNSLSFAASFIHKIYTNAFFYSDFTK
jgi:hypothetical protein